MGSLYCRSCLTYHSFDETRELEGGELRVKSQDGTSHHFGRRHLSFYNGNLLEENLYNTIEHCSELELFPPIHWPQD